MQELLTFDDVLIKPRFSMVESRKDVDISFNKVGFPYIQLPVISANMDTITESKMALAMMNYGAQACLHRFQTIEQNVKMLSDSKLGGTGCYNFPMVSIGLGKAELERAEALFYNGARTFVIDVAHGATMAVVKQTKELKNIVESNASIVVGNFATGESVSTFLEHVGCVVDGFKVGIGPGSLCSTRVKTGCGIPQLHAIMEVSEVLKKTSMTLIADGGIKSAGDVAKSIGAGAHLCMIGGMFSGTEETPGVLVNCEGALYDTLFDQNSDKYKKYRGSASKESYEAQDKTGSHRTAEGESTLVPYKGSVVDVLQDIEGGLRSSFSYVGARTMRDFHNKVEFVRISPSTVRENGAHGKQ